MEKLQIKPTATSKNLSLELPRRIKSPTGMSVQGEEVYYRGARGREDRVDCDRQVVLAHLSGDQRDYRIGRTDGPDVEMNVEMGVPGPSPRHQLGFGHWYHQRRRDDQGKNHPQDQEHQRVDNGYQTQKSQLQRHTLFPPNPTPDLERSLRDNYTPSSSPLSPASFPSPPSSSSSSSRSVSNRLSPSNKGPTADLALTSLNSPRPITPVSAHILHDIPVVPTPTPTPTTNLTPSPSPSPTPPQGLGTGTNTTSTRDVLRVASTSPNPDHHRRHSTVEQAPRELHPPCPTSPSPSLTPLRRSSNHYNNSPLSQTPTVGVADVPVEPGPGTNSQTRLSTALHITSHATTTTPTTTTTSSPLAASTTPTLLTGILPTSLASTGTADWEDTDSVPAGTATTPESRLELGDLDRQDLSDTDVGIRPSETGDLENRDDWIFMLLPRGPAANAMSYGQTQSGRGGRGARGRGGGGQGKGRRRGYGKRSTGDADSPPPKDPSSTAVLKTSVADADFDDPWSSPSLDARTRRWRGIDSHDDQAPSQTRPIPGPSNANAHTSSGSQPQYQPPLASFDWTSPFSYPLVPHDTSTTQLDLDAMAYRPQPQLQLLPHHPSTSSFSFQNLDLDVDMSDLFWNIHFDCTAALIPKHSSSPRRPGPPTAKRRTTSPLGTTPTMTTTTQEISGGAGSSTRRNGPGVSTNGARMTSPYGRSDASSTRRVPTPIPMPVVGAPTPPDPRSTPGSNKRRYSSFAFRAGTAGVEGGSEERSGSGSPLGLRSGSRRSGTNSPPPLTLRDGLAQEGGVTPTGAAAVAPTGSHSANGAAVGAQHHPGIVVGSKDARAPNGLLADLLGVSTVTNPEKDAHIPCSSSSTKPQLRDDFGSGPGGAPEYSSRDHWNINSDTRRVEEAGRLVMDVDMDQHERQRRVQVTGVGEEGCSRVQREQTKAGGRVKEIGDDDPESAWLPWGRSRKVGQTHSRHVPGWGARDGAELWHRQTTENLRNQELVQRTDTMIAAVLGEGVATRPGVQKGPVNLVQGSGTNARKRRHSVTEHGIDADIEAELERQLANNIEHKIASGSRERLEAERMRLELEYLRARVEALEEEEGMRKSAAARVKSWVEEQVGMVAAGGEYVW